MSRFLAVLAMVSLALFLAGMKLTLDSIPEGTDLRACVAMVVGFVGVVGSGLTWAGLVDRPHRSR